jgi:peptide/nickel transport system permease protein
MAIFLFVLRRVAVSIVLLVVASFVVYAGIRATVDPTESLRASKKPASVINEFRESRNLNEPIVSQYSQWFTNFMQGDLGTGDKDNQDVSEKLSLALQNTLELLIWGALFAAVFGITSGVIAGIRKNKLEDYTISFFTTIGIALPVFWFAYVLMELFTNVLPDKVGTDTIFYINGNADGFFGQTESGLWTQESIVEYIRHLALPVMVLSIQLAASWSRYQRGSMVEALQSDYIRTAQSKGMSKFRVYSRHGLRNAQLPMVNVIALDIGALFGGLIITEYIFNIHGMGLVFVEALNAGDATTLVSWTIVTAAAIIAFNLVADLISPIVDPRVRTF